MKYRGKRNFYRDESGECEAWVECGAGKVDYGTNRCVERVTEGFTFKPVKVEKPQPTQPTCLHGTYSPMYELCLCDEPWTGPTCGQTTEVILGVSIAPPEQPIDMLIEQQKNIVVLLILLISLINMCLCCSFTVKKCGKSDKN